MDLDKILMPAILVSHKEDDCSKSPAEDIPYLQSTLKNAKNVEIQYFIDGKIPESTPCQALSAHGFYGIEEKVVTAISNFIKLN